MTLRAPRLRTLIVLLACALGGGALGAEAEGPGAEAKALIERAKTDLDAGLETKNAARIVSARDDLRRAKVLITEAMKANESKEQVVNVLRRDLVDLDIWLAWAEEAAGNAGPGGAGGKPGEKPGAGAAPGGAGSASPDRKEGERFGPWLKQMKKQYVATTSAIERGILARRMGAEAGIHAVDVLMGLFKDEADPKARDGVHEALAVIGTSRVSQQMERFAKPDESDRWPQALDVIYRALERPEKSEPERPWCKAIRDFHELKERKLTLAIQARLDAMGWEGIAALGEVIYVDDFGYHDYTISLLGNKKDSRAVPPLVYKMNRFAFEYAEQMPAHKALMKLGWYAVPELVNRLDDHAAGIWISWTLRKITGETMGTDKRKWGDWWKGESVRHPELFDDPSERPPTTTPTPK